MFMEFLYAPTIEASGLHLLILLHKLMGFNKFSKIIIDR